MTIKEYIVQVEDSDNDLDELFIGYIRKRKQLIRCEDCMFGKEQVDDNGDHYLWCEGDAFKAVEKDYFCGSGRRNE